MTVYLDVVFFENAFMNFLIIYSANLFTLKQSNIFRMIIASILGAVFYVMLMIEISSFFSYSICKIGLVMLLVMIAFKYVDIHTFIQNMIIFLITSFVYGGIMFAIYNLIFNKMFFPYYPIKLLFLISLIVLILFITGIRNIKSIIDYKKIRYDVEITLKSKTKRLKGFLDTGNSLTTLITKKPVMVVNYYSIENMLPQNIRKMYDNNEFNIEKLDWDIEGRVSILPYMSVGNNNGIMLGYKFDKVTIYFSREEKIVLNNTVLGINTTSINNRNDFDALLSIELLEMKRGKNLWGKFQELKN